MIADRFIEQGFVAVRGAFSAATSRACVEVIQSSLKTQGIDLEDRGTWTRPIVRIDCPEHSAFAEAGRSPALARTYDELLGAGNWVPRNAVGGTVPIRFPSQDDPGDADWHIDGSFDVDGEWWLNLRSKARGLLALFLFTDVSEHDAPTELLCGSHLDVPRVLQPHGDRGVPFRSVAPRLPDSTFKRPRALATGKAGDVFVCHPFLIHRATWPHRGDSPRILAQPEIRHREPFKLLGGEACFPVEKAILMGLKLPAS